MSGGFLRYGLIAQRIKRFTPNHSAGTDSGQAGPLGPRTYKGIRHGHTLNKHREGAKDNQKVQVLGPKWGPVMWILFLSKSEQWGAGLEVGPQDSRGPSGG